MVRPVRIVAIAASMPMSFHVGAMAVRTMSAASANSSARMIHAANFENTPCALRGSILQRTAETASGAPDCAHGAQGDADYAGQFAAQRDIVGENPERRFHGLSRCLNA